MKTKLFFIGCLGCVFLSACANNIEEVEFDHTNAYTGMPCHQMPDGSWMGDCE